MMEGTARARAERALRSKRRAAAELEELKPGEEVGVFRRPANKDLTGWPDPDGLIKTEEGGWNNDCQVAWRQPRRADLRM